MNLPFTVAQFLDVFRRYNTTVWPSQPILDVFAIVAIAAALKGGARASRAISAILAALWVWMGVVYHLMFFREINPAATVFGIAFILEGALIAWLGVVRSSLRFEWEATWTTFVGGAMVIYALVVYPFIGLALGHSYPAAPTFGVPCPTTIFTFGMIVWSKEPRSRSVLVIPALWAVLGLSAATQLGIWEDLGLIVAAVVTVVITFHHRPRLSRVQPPMVAGTAR